MTHTHTHTLTLTHYITSGHKNLIDNLTKVWTCNYLLLNCGQKCTNNIATTLYVSTVRASLLAFLTTLQRHLFSFSINLKISGEGMVGMGMGFIMVGMGFIREKNPWSETRVNVCSCAHVCSCARSFVYNSLTGDKFLVVRTMNQPYVTSSILLWEHQDFRHGKLIRTKKKHTKKSDVEMRQTAIPYPTDWFDESTYSTAR